jgi:nicotinamidase-related amidase
VIPIDARGMRFTVRHFVSAPAVRYGPHEEALRIEPDEAALVLVNLYGFLLPAGHPARQGQVAIYGEAEVARREEIIRENLLRVIHSARCAQIPLVYVADSVPNIALERSNIRDVMVSHLGIDPLDAYAESCNDPHEYVPGSSARIVYAPELEPQGDDFYVRKWVYSGFHGTWLDRLLRNLGTKTLFCGGFNGDSDLFCTMFDGHAVGYRMILLRGCHAAVHVSEFEPEMDLTHRLELYAEGSLGFTVSADDFCSGCVGSQGEGGPQ